MTDTPNPADDTLRELIGRAYAQGFRDGWQHPDHMTVPDDLLALEEHYERMAALRYARRLVKADKGAYVHHIDQDPTNNDPRNLIIVRPDENGQED